jgi:dipeptidyl aminopeptidase/acylaminoacyl peptidase
MLAALLVATALLGASAQPFDAQVRQRVCALRTSAERAFSAAIATERSRPKLRAEAQQPLDARSAGLSGERIVVRIDAGKVPGKPTRLAWSPDGLTLYLRFTQRDVWGNEKNSHFLLPPGSSSLQPVDGEPDWAVTYWAWKAALAAPGAPAFRIEIESREERKTATGVVSAGSMAQSGGDPSLGAILGAQGQAIAQSTMQAQNVTTATLKVKGELLSEFVNETIATGRDYGWAPEGLDALAYVNSKHRLAVMDASGHRRPGSDPGEWLLPSWSPDGSRVACVRAEGKKKYTVRVFTVSRH